MTSDLENTQQPQVLLRHAAPDRPLAAAAGPLAMVLADLRVQEPSRSRLLAQNPPVAAVLAWTLEAFARDRIAHKTGFVVAMLQAGYAPPADLERLVTLPVAVWRELALAARQARRTGRAELPPDLAAPFQALYACLGHLEPGEWPIELGDTSGEQQAASKKPGDGELLPPAARRESGPAREGQTARAGARVRQGEPGEGADALRAAQAAWTAALDSLRWQVDRAAFDAWLKRSRVVRAEADCWTVAVADPRAADWLRHRLRPAIERALRWTVGREVAVEFESGPAPGDGA